MNSGIPLPLTFRCSRPAIALRQGWYFFLCVLLFSNWLAKDAPSVTEIFVTAAGKGTGIFILCLLIGYAPVLELTEEGLSFHAMFGQRRLPWTAVRSFSIRRREGFRRVAIDLKSNPAEPPGGTREFSPGPSPRFSRWRKKLTRCAGLLGWSYRGSIWMLPENYGLKATELAKLLEECGRQYTTPEKLHFQHPDL